MMLKWNRSHDAVLLVLYVQLNLCLGKVGHCLVSRELASMVDNIFVVQVGLALGSRRKLFVVGLLGQPNISLLVFCLLFKGIVFWWKIELGLQLLLWGVYHCACQMELLKGFPIPKA
uniref:Putative secreted protein n=1 Tax=Amblyomma parvum TaxID=251391 RepID=A0A023G0F0_AMBPA